MSSIIYILSDVELALTMPDGSQQQFTMQRPNNTENPFWYKIIEDVPSGERIYKDPLRRWQKARAFYRPEFHFSYNRHDMFTTLLLAAINISLITGFDAWHVDCLFDNAEAVRAHYADPRKSGPAELIFTGRKRETWQEALNYFFYYLPGFLVVTADSTEVKADSSEVML